MGPGGEPQRLPFTWTWKVHTDGMPWYAADGDRAFSEASSLYTPDLKVRTTTSAKWGGRLWRLMYDADEAATLE